MDQLSLDEVLRTLPVTSPLEVLDEYLTLRVGINGAWLQAVLAQQSTPSMVSAALAYGFASALEYDAGLALTPNGGALLLAQWVAGARDWSDVGEAAAALLSQLAQWRAALGDDLAVPEATPLMDGPALLAGRSAVDRLRKKLNSTALQPSLRQRAPVAFGSAS